MPDDELERGQSEWNASAYLIRRFARIGTEIREAYIDAQLQNTVNAWIDYKSMLRALFLELSAYIDEDKREEIDGKFDTVDAYLQADEWTNQIPDMLEEIDRELRKQQIEAGIDLKFETELDEEEALVEGLGNG